MAVPPPGEKLSHARGTNSCLPFSVTVNLNFSSELFNPREIILVKLVPVCDYCVLHKNARRRCSIENKEE